MTGLPGLGRLYFGREDAERDVTDGLLRDAFQFTHSYRAAVSGRKMLIIGRKGSGKSAICMRLVAEGGADAGGSVLITPDDAAGDEIRRFALQGLPGDSAKSLIWRYVFAVSAARHLTTHAKEVHRRQPGSVKALRRFLRQNDELPGDRLSDRVAQAARGLQTSLSLEAFGFGASVELTPSPSEGARAARQLDIVEQGVARAFAELRCAGEHRPLLLLVDQLEQVWSAEPDSNSLVIGLLLAAKHAAALYGSAMRCLLFLRSDIYDSLSFGEGDKFHGDELRIAWTDETLRVLALARARTSTGVELSGEQLWREVFPPTVRGEETPAYLLGRCLRRPRDVIQLLNLCQETAWLEHGRERIAESDVLHAAFQFSAWKLNDLALEYLVAHPFLERLFPLFQNTGYVVTRAALGARFDAAAETLHRLFPAYAEALTLSGIVDILYGVGFLGVRRGNDVVFAGGAELPAQPYESEFHVHPCFREALGATSAMDLRPYEPVTAGDRIASGILGSGPRGITSTGRDFQLLQALAGSCHRILQQIGRAVGLAQGPRQELSERVGEVLAEVTEGRWSADPADQLLASAHYFIQLAAELRATGLEGEAAGPRTVAFRIEDEARRLRLLAGGSFGGSGFSSV